MKQYLDLLKLVMDKGVDKDDRTGTGTKSIFGHQARYDLRQGFPLLTTKKVHFKSIVHELVWMLSGNTNIRYLKNNDVRIWDEWADKNGDLGPVYGEQWRKWKGCAGPKDILFTVDQIREAIRDIIINPDSRRIIVSSWNVAQIEAMRLPPCHMIFQFYVSNGELSCHLYQRSADLFLGVPFNIASYALLTHVIAKITNLKVGDFVHTLGDAHIYNNHFEQVNEQILRIPLPLPTLFISDSMTEIDDFCYDHVILNEYESHPAIKGSVAI